MKIFFIVIGVLIVLVAGCIVLSPGTEPENLNTNQPEKPQEPTLKPWEISVGLYDPDIEPNKLTKLLESRLKELGFKTVILNELVDPGSANQEKTTLLFRPATEDALEVVIDKVINRLASYRKGQNEAIIQDIIISAWNIDDINWGGFSELASKYNNPDPAEVSILVLNSGAEPGAAGSLAELLTDQGYSQVEFENSEEEEVATKPALITYQRNYKNVAKGMRKFLVDNNYPNTSYQIKLDQQANIVITLGPDQDSAQPEE